MNDVKRLMTGANPVPERPDRDLSARARAELTALVGPEPPTTGRATRTRRRLVPAIAVAVVVVAVGVVVALRTLGASPPPTTDEPFYESTQALEAKADLIVRGRLESTREQTDSGFPETVATVTVVRVAKGDNVAAGQRIEVAYTTPGSGPETPTGLAPGGEYVLLLVRATGAPANLVNTTQGYYPVSDGRAIPAPGNPVPLSDGVKQALDVR
jgi:hypothetical protein